MFVSRYSKKKARPIPPKSPITVAMRRVSPRRGFDGDSGTSARSTIAMFEVRSADEICVSLSRVRSAV